MLYVMTDYYVDPTSPIGAAITAGRFYPAKPTKLHPAEAFQGMYDIIDDRGFELNIRVNRPSAHLDDIGIFKLFGEVDQ